MHEVQGTLTCPPTPPHPNPKKKRAIRKKEAKRTYGFPAVGIYMIFDIFWCMDMHWCAMNKFPSGGFSPQILNTFGGHKYIPSTTTFPSSGPRNEEPKYWTRALGTCVYCDSGMWFIQTHPTLARTTHDCLLISPPCFCVRREWYSVLYHRFCSIGLV